MALRVLIIDEQHSVRFALSEYFLAQGYEVDTARSMGQAQAILMACEYALIISDLRMGREHGPGGLRLLQYIRQHHPSTRIIALTEQAIKDYEETCMVDLVLQKPKSLATIASLALHLLQAA